MTETQCAEALATLLRAYATAPLKDCEVHVQSQIGYEDADGSVTVLLASGREVAEAIGDQFKDEVSFRIVGVIPFADTEANRQSIETLCAQIRYILRDNRTLSAGGELAQRNQDITWEYGFASVGDQTQRQCTVNVVYRIPQTATP